MKKLFFILTAFTIINFSCKKDTPVSGNETEGTFTDTRDNKTYKWAKIGTQTWMVDNMAFNTNSGNWAYDNNNSNIATYGYLYNWAAAQTAVPAGWHLPTEAEWLTLKTFLGGAATAGGKMKQATTTLWDAPNTGATNESKFNGAPGGHRTAADQFVNIRKVGYWWSKTEPGPGAAYIHFLLNDGENAGIATSNFTAAFSIRCIKD